MVKRELPEGPWTTEPDHIEWRDEATGLPCIIRRGPSGALCGYVAVPPGHPWHGIGYSGCTQPAAEHKDDYCYEHAPDVNVHGGLTYADSCSGEPGEGICHKAAEGEPDDVWWFGFDCAHLHDLSPAYGGLEGCDEVYRDVAYVRAEVTDLARQLAAVGP
jgi:hypothetical protein